MSERKVWKRDKICFVPSVYNSAEREKEIQIKTEIQCRLVTTPQQQPQQRNIMSHWILRLDRHTVHKKWQQQFKTKNETFRYESNHFHNMQSSLFACLLKTENIKSRRNDACTLHQIIWKSSSNSTKWRSNRKRRFQVKIHKYKNEFSFRFLFTYHSFCGALCSIRWCKQWSSTDIGCHFTRRWTGIGK